MSRRSQVVRSTTKATSNTPRSAATGAMILCHRPDSPGSDTEVLVGPINITVTTAYQRIFITGTVAGIELTGISVS